MLDAFGFLSHIVRERKRTDEMCHVHTCCTHVYTKFVPVCTCTDARLCMHACVRAGMKMWSHVCFQFKDPKAAAEYSKKRADETTKMQKMPPDPSSSSRRRRERAPDWEPGDSAGSEFDAGRE
mmetsp:Transcript_19799/g.37230  ORF Transcript_19799/g.37230 Transcript_19799/m.37230 type:complete len:123 (+) Transcript_19799:1001-1369(+)